MHPLQPQSRAIALSALDPCDTIAAPATAPGPAARSIVRLSGPQAFPIALAGFSTCESNLRVSPRRAARLRAGCLKVTGLRPILPVMLAQWPGPRSYTGQDVAEIHLTGSVPLVSLLLSHYFTLGARPAEPGEFTLRAFLSGRIDLTRAEAVLGVIDAQNPAQLTAALEQLAGGLSHPITGLRDRLLDLVAHLEANLDFTEEPDVDPLSRAALAHELEDFASELGRIGRQLSERERSLEHSRVVLVGPPNSGKSRLFNALLGRDRSIVSPHSGTTRDYIAEICDCDGLSVELIDTAGFENPTDSVGIRAQDLRDGQAAGADLLLDCRCAVTEAASEGTSILGGDRIPVWTKADLALPEPDAAARDGLMITSALTGAGLAALRSEIAGKLRSNEAQEGPLSSTGARCRGSLARARAALRSAATLIVEGAGDELVAFDLRLAVDELGQIVGAVVTDDILERIFRRFCVGK
jgi:tRNA modification GTPase